MTDRRVGHDLDLVNDGRPKPVDRLRSEIGADNCFTSAVPYRARVMRDLFGIDDSVRYRNLIHLLYRLRRPTIGDRLEAGELVGVLSEALPPMDESITCSTVYDVKGVSPHIAAIGPHIACSWRKIACFCPALTAPAG